MSYFFCISGFIFYWLYSKNISDGKVSPISFFINRISRLYPLYIISFLSVATLQFIYIKSHGSYFIYQHNDLYHAILNILMIPAWGFENGWSFNAPVWSVSIEVILYSIFFLVCIFGNLRIFIIPFFIVFGYYIFDVNYKIGIGLYSFFCGAATYIIYSFLLNKFGAKPLLLTSSIYMAFGWLTIYTNDIYNSFIVTGIGFTSLISFLVSINCVNKVALVKLNPIGNLSYSSYLIHFPLQIIFSLIVDSIGLERSVFYNPLSIIVFISTLIPLSLAVHKYYEMPAQKYIRNITLTNNCKSTN